MYIRFEEISSCHFARSDSGTVTRTFDFEIDLKTGSSLTFSAMDKEENNKLFDYLNKKEIKIRNSHRIDNKSAGYGSSDEDDIDPYKSTVKAEGREQDDDSDDESTDEDYDLDKDMKKQKNDKDSSEGSGSEPDDEYDSGSEKDASGTGESDPDEENIEPKKKESKEKKNKREKKEKPVKEKAVKKGKKTKDPNEPKRATTAYIIWFNANRNSMKEDGDTLGDVAKKAGAKWKSMSADDKKEWNDKAAQDKARYEAEMKEYKKNGGGVEKASGPSTKKSSDQSPGKQFKSKEHISDTDDSDDDEPLKAKKDESDAASESSGESD